MSENEYGNLKKAGLLHTNTIKTRGNITSDFRIYFCNVIVFVKTTLSTLHQKMWHVMDEDLDQNDDRIIS